MRSTGIFSVPVRVVVATGLLYLAGCETTSRPQAFKAFFLPPQPRPSGNSVDQVPEPPKLHQDLYANEAPAIRTALPDALPRPSDSDFLLKRADDRVAAGRLA